MITKTLHKFYLALFIFMLSISVHASEVALPDDAKAMCEKAATFIKENGIEAAKTAFQTPGAPWHDRDLYVFIFDKTGVMIAHGAKEALVGRNLSSMRDIDGKFMTQEMIDVKDTGWVDYKWQNPTTKKVAAKTSYVINIGDYIVAVGAYK